MKYGVVICCFWAACVAETLLNADTYLNEKKSEIKDSEKIERLTDGLKQLLETIRDLPTPSGKSAEEPNKLQDKRDTSNYFELSKVDLEEPKKFTEVENAIAGESQKERPVESLSFFVGSGKDDKAESGDENERGRELKRAIGEKLGTIGNVATDKGLLVRNDLLDIAGIDKALKGQSMKVNFDDLSVATPSNIMQQSFGSLVPSEVDYNPAFVMDPNNIQQMDVSKALHGSNIQAFPYQLSSLQSNEPCLLQPSGALPSSNLDFNQQLATMLSGQNSLTSQLGSNSILNNPFAVNSPYLIPQMFRARRENDLPGNSKAAVKNVYYHMTPSQGSFRSPLNLWWENVLTDPDHRIPLKKRDYAAKGGTIKVFPLSGDADLEDSLVFPSVYHPEVLQSFKT